MLLWLALTYDLQGRREESDDDEDESPAGGVPVAVPSASAETPSASAETPSASVVTPAVHVPRIKVCMITQVHTLRYQPDMQDARRNGPVSLMTRSTGQWIPSC
jgi:hypothetical protein